MINKTNKKGCNNLPRQEKSTPIPAKLLSIDIGFESFFVELLLLLLLLLSSLLSLLFNIWNGSKI